MGCDINYTLQTYKKSKTLDSRESIIFKTDTKKKLREKLQLMDPAAEFDSK